MSIPFKINGVTVKTPRIKYSRYNVTKHGRLANALMTFELLGKKRKLFCNYPAITGSELKLIYDQIDTDEVTFDITYIEEDGSEVTKTFYGGELASTRHRWSQINDEGILKDVSFNFIEQ